MESKNVDNRNKKTKKPSPPPSGPEENERFFYEIGMAKELGISLRSLRNRRYRRKNHPPFVEFGYTIVYPKEEFRKWYLKQLEHEMD